MPFYQIYHTYPLHQTQRQSIALSITNLHCKAFSTPAFFVHVSFSYQDSKTDDGTYFMAGKLHSGNSNRIVALVRTSASRTKEDFDNLAASIEDAWNKALREPIDKNIKGNDEFDESKRLLMVVFTPILAIREGGMVIPEAGHDDNWLTRQLPYVKALAEKHNINDFKDLVGEIEQWKTSHGQMD
ncbi:uncharacterized protein ColSpa_03777 [Colletotrichum spaethianum]|uniref:Tautomerase cis-CaaD-like domain-containing protein n=1 Tax=Colletotrichum spaethianum TaxID=700344 RepID=A0AA37P5F0_9PEZI|nr:uncharacterized protein ColSpa_03777 [Colletotrichum spaethianum]GKT43596.1 hypothetical protein ColSpa_03777 [Colletotrichum spaethianum]